MPQRLFRRRGLSLRLQQVCKLLEGEADHPDVRAGDAVQREARPMRFSSQGELQTARQICSPVGNAERSSARPRADVVNIF